MVPATPIQESAETRITAFSEVKNPIASSKF